MMGAQQRTTCRLPSSVLFFTSEVNVGRNGDNKSSCDKIQKKNK